MMKNITKLSIFFFSQEINGVDDYRAMHLIPAKVLIRAPNFMKFGLQSEKKKLLFLF